MYIRRPFRRGSLRFRLILLVSFQILLVFAVIVLHSRLTTCNEQQTELEWFNKTKVPAFASKSVAGPVTTKKPKEKAEIDMANDYHGQRKSVARAHKTTVKPVGPVKTIKPTKKAEIDMVNDYQPWIDFKFVYPEVQPTIQGPRDFYLVVLVNSGAKGDEFRQRRAKIRETWASRKTCEYTNAMNISNVKDLKWILVFVLGKAGSQEDERNIEEAKIHNDMIIGDISDNYFNNILKFYMGQLWASMLGTIKYTLKTDDDVYIRIPKVIEYLVSLGSPTRFYGGQTYLNYPVIRRAGAKWGISKKYFPEKTWPPFNAGGFIIMSTDLLGSLINYVYIRKPFHTDDAYVGVAMRDFKVKVVHILSFVVENSMPAMIRKKNNCDILKLIAYGHSLNIDSIQYLHKRVEDLCQLKKTVDKYCG